MPGSRLTILLACLPDPARFFERRAVNTGLPKLLTILLGEHVRDRGEPLPPRLVDERGATPPLLQAAPSREGR
jgi:hypothetical protein